MVKFEQYANNAVSTLSGSLTDVATTLTVSDASAFPSDGNFRILVGTELMLVTARSGSDFTVTRGIEDTTALAHDTGAEVRFIVTEGSFLRLMADHLPFFQEPNNAGPLNSLTDDAGSAVNAASFTAVNQGSSTLTNIGTPVIGLNLFPPVGTGANLRIYKKSAPSTPYTIYGAFSMNLYPSASITHCGFCLRESGTSKVKVMGFGSGQLSSVYRASYFIVGNYTDATTFSTWDEQEPWGFDPGQVWARMEDDGVDIKFALSTNGLEFQEVFSEARGTFFTTAPDEIGIYFNANHATIQQSMLVNHWSEQ